MGVLTRALRNIARRKVRALLVVIALSLSMAILISVPAGIMANQEAAEELKETYENYLVDITEEIEEAYLLLEIQYSSGGRMGWGTKVYALKLNLWDVQALSYHFFQNLKVQLKKWKPLWEPSKDLYPTTQ
jgi:hypothetical protein